MPGKKNVCHAVCWVLLFFMFGCAAQQAGTTVIKSEEPDAALSQEEKREKAYDIFKQILALRNAPEREENLPEVKRLYREIITRYPDIALAQEAYLRLVILAREEGGETGEAEAQKLYQEFRQSYPESTLRKHIEYELKGQGEPD